MAIFINADPLILNAKQMPDDPRYQPEAGRL
jgi:hypothetical protein